MMNELKILGTEKVGNFKFTGIEGGFGKNKKSMLVKDIAVIHGKEVRQINQAINMNRKRFKNGIDILDLKENNFAINLMDSGFTQNQINASNNIYLLSERGYAKLLKILEDDKAWEIYDELVDNYFNMRYVIQKQDSYMITDPVQRAKRWIEEQEEHQVKLDEEVRKNEILQPKALFADSVAASHTTILIGELAKILRGNGINIGANRLFQWMRDQGYLISRKGTDYNMPTQRSMNLGLFKIKESTITHSNGSVSISKTTKVTGKGQQYFINKFMKMNETAIG